MLLLRTGGSLLKQRTDIYPRVVAWNNLTYSKGKKQKKERKRKGNRKEKEDLTPCPQNLPDCGRVWSPASVVPIFFRLSRISFYPFPRKSLLGRYF
jgi:hypothetical protein